MTLSLPRNHTIETRINAESQTELRLDDGPWTPSTIASLHKLAARWLDLSAAEIPAAWEETTGERIVLDGETVRA